MLKYIVKRILQAIPIVLIITILCFFLMNQAPYDVADSIGASNDLSKREIEELRSSYGLDESVYIQYIKWLKNFAQGEFGYSLTNGTNIRQDLMIRIPNTLKLAVPAYFTAFMLAILLGLWAGSSKNKWTDKIIDGFCSIGIATPTFWFGLLIIYFLGYRLKFFPLMGMHTIGQEDSFFDFLSHFVMPYIVFIIGFLPSLTRYVRSSTIGQYKEDYVMVQEAFGSKKSEILLRHVSKNVSLPLITRLGLDLPKLIIGAVVIETIFSWPGIGTYFTKAVQSLDYPIVMAMLVLSGIVVILGSLIADVLYGVIDPRIRTMR